MRIRMQIPLLVLALLAGCAIWDDWPHQNFRQTFDAQVGKHIDDPLTSVNRYPQKIVAKRILPNGNQEIEYIHLRSQIRDAKCAVFFEVDAETRIIVNWRYEGDEKVCVISP